MRKVVYITAGVVSVILGIVGIFVPGLPTTPFLLLSSWLFYKSSQRLHSLLHRSRLGAYIRRYESRQGISRRSKLFSIFCMWAMISLSTFVFIEDLRLRLLLFALGVIGTASVVWIVPGEKRAGGRSLEKDS